MREKHRIHWSILGQMFLMLQKLIKIITIHRETYRRKLKHLDLDRLDYLPDSSLITVEKIQISHKTFQMTSRRKKLVIKEILYAQVVRICRKIMV